MQSVVSPKFNPRFTHQNLQAGGSNSQPITLSSSPPKNTTIKAVKFGESPFEKIKNNIAEFFALIIAYIFTLGLKRKAEQAEKAEGV